MLLQAQQGLCAKRQGAPRGPSGPAAVYQQETLSKGSVSTRLVHHFVLERFASCAPARTEPASAPVTRALAGSWLLISLCGTQSLPSLHPSVAPGNTQCLPSLFQTKLTQTVLTCGCKPSCPFLLLTTPPIGAIQWITRDMLCI